MSRKQIRRLALAIGASTLIAYFAVTVPQRRELTALGVRMQSLYDTANENDRIISAEPEILSSQVRLRRSIVTLAGQSLGSAYAELLASWEREAVACGVRIVSVSPSDVADREDRFALKRSRATIEMEGTFRAVVAMLARFSESGELVGIRGLSLHPISSSDPMHPGLLAAIDANVYTLRQGWEVEVSHEAATLRR
jgi:hypothetical protein